VPVIRFDGKATPTATEAELTKRQGPRAVNPHPGSRRHRGRAIHRQRGAKKRRQKGDKAKNGKMATIVVWNISGPPASVCIAKAASN
jgi:hypothetical protein